MKRIILIFLFFLPTTFLLAQDGYVYGDTESTVKKEKKKGFDWNKVTIGGGLGMTFGSITYIQVAPDFGYYLTDNVLVGIGGNYIYYEDKAFDFSTHIFGGKIFGQYLFENMPLLAHAETELINIDDGLGKRLNIINVYVGGGIKQRFSGGSFFYILALWNLNETKESAFYNPSNPVIRGGIAFGL